MSNDRVIKVEAEEPATPSSGDDDSTADGFRTSTEGSTDEDSIQRGDTDNSDTSLCGADYDRRNKEEELQRTLAASNEENVSLREQLDSSNHKLLEETSRNTSLQARYNAQLAARRNDHAKLKDYANVANEQSDRYDELETSLKDKEGEVIQWKGTYQEALNAAGELSSKHEEIINVKDEILERMQLLLAAREVETQQISKDAAEEKHRILEVTSANRESREAEIKSLQSDVQRMRADFKDTMGPNVVEIETLTKRNIALEKENAQINGVKKFGNVPTLCQLQEITNANGPFRKKLRG